MLKSTLLPQGSEMGPSWTVPGGAHRWTGCGPEDRLQQPASTCRLGTPSRDLTHRFFLPQCCRLCWYPDTASTTQSAFPGQVWAARPCTASLMPHNATYPDSFQQPPCLAFLPSPKSAPAVPVHGRLPHPLGSPPSRRHPFQHSGQCPPSPGKYPEHGCGRGHREHVAASSNRRLRGPLDPAHPLIRTQSISWEQQ